MRDHIELGPSPVEEECLQMGVATNEDCKAECVRYKALLEQVCPIPLGLQIRGCRYGVKFFPYDAPAGGYYEAVLYYLDDDEDQVEFAFGLEERLPLTWDACPSPTGVSQ